MIALHENYVIDETGRRVAVQLPIEEWEALKKLLEAQRWDEQIEQDVHAGRLDALANEALQQKRTGQYREL
jgi:hypothetical protein